MIGSQNVVHYIKLRLNKKNEYIYFSKVWWCKLSFIFKKMDTEKRNKRVVEEKDV